MFFHSDYYCIAKRNIDLLELDIIGSKLIAIGGCTKVSDKEILEQDDWRLLITDLWAIISQPTS